MDKKTIVMLALGVFCAAVICLIVGAIVFLFSGSNGVMYFTGIAMMCLGGAMGIIPLFILVCTLVIKLISRAGKGKDDENIDKSV